MAEHVISGIETRYPHRLHCGESVGWSVCAIADADAYGTSAVMAAGAESTGWTQLTAASIVRIEGAAASGNTGIIATVAGVDTNGRKVYEELPALTTGTGTASCGTVTFRYVENVFLSSKVTTGATIIVEQTTGTDITTIKGGQLWTAQCQHFTGHLTSYITYFAGGLNDNSTDNIWYDLRWYPDDSLCVKSTDSANGFIILARLFCFGLHADTGLAPNQAAHHAFPTPIRCPAGGWISVWATAGAASSEGWVMMQGFDVDEGGAGGTIA